MCGSATPFIPVSQEMQRYSFAKFLELHFYPADVQLVQGAGCQHNIYQHHVRYFAIKGMTVRFVTDPIVLHEVVYPPMRVRVRPETQLEIKNADYQRLHRRNAQWYSDLIGDLQLLQKEASEVTDAEEETDELFNSHIVALINKAEWEKEDIAKLIDQIYKDTSPTDTLALNQVRAYRQDKIVAWQQDFDRLPKMRASTSSEKGISGRRFNSVRAMFPKRGDSYIPEFDRPAPASVSEVEENLPVFPTIMRRVTGDSFASQSSASASEASESESMTGEPGKKLKDSELSSVEADQPKATDATVTPETGSALLPPAEITPDSELVKSDPDSDSTIGAGKGDGVLSDDAVSPPQVRYQIDVCMLILIIWIGAARHSRS